MLILWLMCYMQIYYKKQWRMRIICGEIQSNVVENIYWNLKNSPINFYNIFSSLNLITVESFNMMPTNLTSIFHCVLKNDLESIVIIALHTIQTIYLWWYCRFMASPNTINMLCLFKYVCLYNIFWMMITLAFICYSITSLVGSEKWEEKISMLILGKSL